MLKDALERIARIGRDAVADGALGPEQRDTLDHLRTHGYVMFDHLVGTERLARLQADYKNRVETRLEFELPTLAQAKVDPARDADLVAKNFAVADSVLEQRGLTFSRADIKSYEQAISEFAPSTLTVDLPDTTDWFDLWLDPHILPIVEAYMGFAPQMVEAYIRRNFPARFVVMNHAWHRDMNHDKYLLKSFVFLSDCTLKTGPHHYIAGSVEDRRIDGKTYYSDAEIHAAYPPASGREIVSVVPAGTIILEDTRGLHKAGIPEEGYRDLGYATFLPPIAFKRREPQYHIGRETYDSLSPDQRKYIPPANVFSERAKQQYSVSNASA
jgi:hypothetical protein